MVFSNTQYQDIDCKGRSECFDTLSDDELEALEQSKLIVRYKKGEIIAKQGSSSTDVLFIQRGFVKFYREFSNTRTLIMIEKKCNFIGLENLFIERVMPHTLMALTDCVICSFNNKLFEKLVSKNNIFAIETLKNINLKSLKMIDDSSSKSSKQMHGRIAWAILELTQGVFRSDNLEISFSRKDLSEYTNMSVMSVGRILREFSDESLINLDKNKISILEKDKLISICKNG